jgi:acetolactate synthase-1/2/3 large subunit
MTDPSPGVPAARTVVEALLAAGVDHAFCVPGESFLGLLDALYDEPRIRVIATRHEGGASFMAEAYGKLTRRPAVCMGTRMVGAGNLAIGIHSARQDSTPLIALLGQVATESRYREAFQEVDLPHAFGPVAKWAVEPPRADRLGELTLRAGRVAVSGRPGPVVVALREDLLNEPVDRLDPQPVCVPRPAPDAETVAHVLALLRAAERPVLLLGQGVLASGATLSCVRLAEAEQVPVIAAWRRPDVFPNTHPLYLGHSGIGAPHCVRERLLGADLVLAIGVRLDEYTTFDFRVPAPASRLVHVDLAAEDLGGHRQADVSCVADAARFVDALHAAAAASPPPAVLLAAREDRNAADRATWEAQTTPTRGRARTGFVDQQAVVAHLRAVLAPDTIVTTDAGNFGMWPARYLRWHQPGTFLGSTSGAMGYAIPAAIAAKLARPAQLVVAFVGDGGFLMTGPEIETAVRENAPLVALVYDNAQYGTIRMHQEREHPGRPIATALGPVDIAGFAQSLGGLGIAVRDDQEFASAFAEALGANRPAVLHLRVDPEQLSVVMDA